MGMQEELLGRAGKKARERYRALYGPDPQPAQAVSGGRRIRVKQLPDDPLEDVTFASPQARQLAEEEGLTWADFAFTRVGSTGETGWRVDDVRRVLKELDQED